MIDEQTSKRIKQLEFDVNYERKKYDKKCIQYNVLVKNVNEALLDDRKTFQDIIKQIDGK